MHSEKIVFPQYCTFLERENCVLAFNPNTLVLAEINATAKLILNALRQPRDINSFLDELRLLLPHWREDQFTRVQNLLIRWLQEGLIETAETAAQQLKWRYEPQEALPEEIYITPTDQCNLSCIYCYNRKFRRKQHLDKIAELNLSEWVNVLSEIKSMKFKRVILTGGEPLVSPLLRPLVYQCKQLGLESRLLTNGTLIDKEWAEWIANNIDLVNISLDSAIPEENDAVRGASSFEKITRGVRNLMEAQAKSVYIRAVITSYNVQNLPDLVDFCHNELKCGVGAPTIFIPTSMEEAKNSDLMPDFDTYFEKILDFTARTLKLTGKNPWEEFQLDYACRCGIGLSTASIDPRGDVFPCQAFHHDDMKAGNIRNGGFENIYKNSPLLNQLRTLPLERIPVCCDCTFVTVCGGGCRAIARDLYGNVLAHNELFCSVYKRGAIDKLWRWIKLAKSDNKKQIEDTFS